MLRLSDFDAVTFDVYGTLIDWEPSIVAFLQAWAQEQRVTASGDELIMSFDRARAAIQKERPAHLYPDVLRRCFDRISADYGVAVDPARREAFSRTPHDWPAYADTEAGLKALQARARIGALSNIDNASLASSCAKMSIRFDIIVTAERVGAYKPSDEHFATALADLDAVGIPRHARQQARAQIGLDQPAEPPAWAVRGRRGRGPAGPDGVEPRGAPRSHRLKLAINRQR